MRHLTDFGRPGRSEIGTSKELLGTDHILDSEDLKVFLAGLSALQTTYPRVSSVEEGIRRGNGGRVGKGHC